MVRNNAIGKHVTENEPYPDVYMQKMQLIMTLQLHEIQLDQVEYVPQQCCA